MIDIKWWLIIALAGILLFMIITRSIREPLKWMGFGVLYTAIGGLVLFLLNLAGEAINIEIPINPITAFIAGSLGIPGIIYLYLVKLIVLP